jgi:hypothetical protein
MANTPRQETLTVPAAGILPVQISGRWLTILSNTVATVDVAFDNDGYTPMLAGIPYPAMGGQYEKVRFRDTGGAGCTLVAVFSDQQTPDNRGGPLAAAMAASLVSIDQEISGAAADPVTGQLADTIVAQTGVGTTLLFAANPARTEVEITADLANGAEIVYLGIAALRCTVADKFYPLLAGDPWFSNREKGPIYACSDLGTAVVFGREC